MCTHARVHARTLHQCMRVHHAGGCAHAAEVADVCGVCVCARARARAALLSEYLALVPESACHYQDRACSFGARGTCMHARSRKIAAAKRNPPPSVPARSAGPCDAPARAGPSAEPSISYEFACFVRCHKVFLNFSATGGQSATGTFEPSEERGRKKGLLAGWMDAS
jgi:hypothetical protein